MPVHTVRQGESVATLAKRWGVHPDSIWEHPDNAELKDFRKNPFVLKPGDTLTIPDPEEREESVATERVHEFVLSRKMARFEMRFLHEGEPRAGWSYLLGVDDEAELRKGELDDDGWLRIDIPADVEHGVIHLYPPDEESDGDEEEGAEEAGDEDLCVEYELHFHHLDPADEPSGARQRLHSLGLHAGAEEDGLGPKTRAALRAFQLLHGLDPTGDLDSATIDELRSKHG